MLRTPCIAAASSEAPSVHAPSSEAPSAHVSISKCRELADSVWGTALPVSCASLLRAFCVSREWKVPALRGLRRLLDRSLGPLGGPSGRGSVIFGGPQPLRLSLLIPASTFERVRLQLRLYGVLAETAPAALVGKEGARIWAVVSART